MQDFHYKEKIQPIIRVESLYFASIFNGFYVQEKEDSKVIFSILGDHVAYVINTNDRHCLQEEELENKLTRYQVP